jgi:signal transduction histidine kinase/CheY-like chemotaxis protein
MMRRILIIDDQPINRKMLATLLRSAGYAVVEASDGEEALLRLPNVKPHLVISDILMPTVDGFEFVRRMRESPALGRTPVIFYTATYHEREARTLADQCGIVDILTKPSATETILATVRTALKSRRSPNAPLDRESFERERQRLAISTVTTPTDTVGVDEQWMMDMVGVVQRLAAERDRDALLNTLCAGTRQMTLAQHAVARLLAEDESAVLFTSGLDDETTATMRPASMDSAVFTDILEEHRPVRMRNPEGLSDTLALPAGHPLVTSFLGVAIESAGRAYGWLTLRNKLGAPEFTEADERIAAMLAALAGIAYENARLHSDLQQRAAALDADRRRVSARARALQEEERARLSRTLHDQLGQALAGLKMDLSWLGSQAVNPEADLTKDVIQKADSMLQRIDETIQIVRHISGELRPAVLDHGDLVAAIEWHAGAFERRSGIRCRVNARIKRVALNGDRATAVFRIVQEALTNVFHHARATRVTISVHESAGRLTVLVADNGCGISDVDLVSRHSLGLTGMRERAALLGGAVDFRRRRPAGTTVTITVPLTDKADQPGDAAATGFLS